MTGHSCIIPGMSYRDAGAAIEWLCRVFGFEARTVHRGPDNSIIHAELTLGGGMLMLGSAKPGKEGLLERPKEPGNAETRSVTVVVADPDGVLERVRAEGGEVIVDIADNPYGGRGFVCRDLEGRVWWVNSYDPWG